MRMGGCWQFNICLKNFAEDLNHDIDATPKQVAGCFFLFSVLLCTYIYDFLFFILR